MVNIGSTSTGGKVISVKADLAKITLIMPACTEIGEKVALSRRVEKHWASGIFLYRISIITNVLVLSSTALGRLGYDYGRYTSGRFGLDVARTVVSCVMFLAFGGVPRVWKLLSQCLAWLPVCVDLKIGSLTYLVQLLQHAHL